MSRELDAAGITEPVLRASYLRCREINAAHGRTYFLATRLLPAASRPAIHALYGLARYADEIVDDLSDTRPWSQRLAELDDLAEQLRVGLARGCCQHPVLAAAVHTAVRYRIAPQHFTDFMAAMRMDRPVEQGGVAGYQTFDDLARYVHGSAAVIGLQVLPVLGTVVCRERAEPHAAALGIAFQITNFLRDVGEDLDRGRVYLPAEELAAFGVDRDLLVWCRSTGRLDPRVRRALAHLVARTRAIYRRAAPGIPMLAPVSRACVATAFTLYGGILDEIESAGYDVLARRVVVPKRRKLAVALPGLSRALLARVAPG
ncbi:MAG TPA: phytoene/squalene synthase family protein [Pseudonocardiaceae bacterium]|jgi:phytoene synthase|nr:phytoene/squalene synthase family protein [Pseudonocardiaceae bacterium]